MSQVEDEWESQTIRTLVQVLLICVDVWTNKENVQPIRSVFSQTTAVSGLPQYD